MAMLRLHSYVMHIMEKIWRRRAKAMLRTAEEAML